MKPSLVIVGLGNPGVQYEKTRHNVGFQAIDVLAKELGLAKATRRSLEDGAGWKEKQKFSALAQEGRIAATPILLVKPMTFMNRSGEAVKKIIDFYKLDPTAQILILSDDVDLPLGDVRLRKSGGPGTHNGLKSIVEQIGEGFLRIRIGLGTAPPGSDLATWVLSVPRADEVKALQDAYEKIPSMLREFIVAA